MTRLTDDDITTIREMVAGGRTCAEVGAIFSRSPRSIYNIARGYRYSGRGGPPVAPKYKPRLTDQQVVDAKQSHDDGMTWVTLGRLLKVDPAVVSRACRGKRRGK